MQDGDSLSKTRRSTKCHGLVFQKLTQLHPTRGSWFAHWLRVKEVASATSWRWGVCENGTGISPKVRRILTIVLLVSVCIDNYLIRAALGATTVAIVSEFHFDLEAKAALLSAFFWGYFCFNLPAGLAAARYGGGVVLGTAAVSWSLVALVLPVLAEDGNVSHLVACMFLLGIAAAPCLPASSAVISVVAAPGERGRLIAVRSASLRLGQLTSTLVTPALCSDMGWRFVFRIFGLLGLLISFLWLRFVSVDADVAHGNASDGTCGDSSALSSRGEALPCQLLCYRAVWIVIGAHASINGVFYTLLSWGPTYFAEVLDVPFEAVGLPLMLPVAAMMLGNLGSGALMDKMLERGHAVLATRRKVLTSSLLSSAVMLVVFAQIRSVPVATSVLSIASFALGVADTTVLSNYLDVAPSATGSLVGLGNTFATLPGALGPVAIALVLSQTGSWQVVFNALSVCLVLASYMFFTFGAADDVSKRHTELPLRAFV